MKLCIDPGHGMSNVRSGVYDPGASGGGLTEAGIVLQWSDTLQFLSKGKFESFMTRVSDHVDDPIGTRVKRAVDHGCTHFVALHCNSAGPTASGCETFYKGDDDLAFARNVHASVLAAMGSKDRGIKPEGKSQHTHLAVLKFPGPACLVELGFISNSSDRAKLVSRDVRIAFANELIRRLTGG